MGYAGVYQWRSQNGIIFTHTQEKSWHYENMPVQIYWKFYHQKKENFPIKNSDISLFLLKT